MSNYLEIEVRFFVWFDRTDWHQKHFNASLCFCFLFMKCHCNYCIVMDFFGGWGLCVCACGVCIFFRFVCISVLSVVILGLILRIRCILVYIYLSTYICILLKHSLQDRFNFFNIKKLCYTIVCYLTTTLISVKMLALVNFIDKLA